MTRLISAGKLTDSTFASREIVSLNLARHESKSCTLEHVSGEISKVRGSITDHKAELTKGDA